MTQTVALQRAVRYLAADGWHISSMDKDLGIVSAYQTVIMGEGKTVPLNVSIEPVASGAKVMVTFPIAGGLSTSRDGVVKGFCSLMEAIGRP